MNSPKKLVFVVGVGRSGTTLLQSMLNNHSNITFPPESNIVSRYVVPEYVKKNKTSQDSNEIKKQLVTNTNIDRLEINIDEVIKQVLREGTFTYKRFFCEIIKNYCKKNKKEIGGEKDPVNVHYIAELSECFPESIFIHIIRDPRDIILSRGKVKWADKMSFLKHLLEFKYGIFLAEKGRQYCKNRYIEVRYEELLLNPERELKILSSFLNLEYEKDMLTYYKTSNTIVSKEELSWKANVMKPILSDNINKWKKEMGRGKLFLLEVFLVNEMRKLGYDLKNNSILLKIANVPTIALFAYYKWKLSKN